MVHLDEGKILVMVFSQIAVVPCPQDGSPFRVSRQYMPGRIWAMTLYGPSQFDMSLPCSTARAMASVWRRTKSPTLMGWSLTARSWRRVILVL